MGSWSTVPGNTCREDQKKLEASDRGHESVSGHTKRPSPAPSNTSISSVHNATRRDVTRQSADYNPHDPRDKSNSLDDY